ncbi:hypothetical protein BDFG_04223 [Blastomyces dermatitidis ATCC 26199]|nr:hypothetical protein BDFG_04223 [Blastomyces dermatitidis ATCC 26199]
MVRRVEKGLNTDELTSTRDDTSLQGTATTTAVTREAEEGEEDIEMRVMLSRLIDTVISTFNLAFLAVMETAAAS